MTRPQRNVLIVGASSSVGTVVVDRFLASGDHVVATYNAHPPEYTAAELQWVRLDVTVPQQRDTLIAEVASVGALDVVLLLSGLLPGNSLVEYEPTLADRVMAVNFTGPAMLLQGLLPHMALDSSIIFMASVSGQRGSYDPFYAAAKGAVLPFVKSMARALGPRTRVNAVAPALIADSTMHDDMAPEIRANHRAQTPNGDFVQISDLATQLYEITQPHWRSLNGACVDLNGGSYLR